MLQFVKAMRDKGAWIVICRPLGLTARPELLEACLAPTSVNFHRNASASLLRNQWLALAILLATSRRAINGIAQSRVNINPAQSHISLTVFDDISVLDVALAICLKVPLSPVIPGLFTIDGSSTPTLPTVLHNNSLKDSRNCFILSE